MNEQHARLAIDELIEEDSGAAFHGRWTGARFELSYFARLPALCDIDRI
jgi:hypothetical protein